MDSPPIPCAVPVNVDFAHAKLLCWRFNDDSVRWSLRCFAKAVLPRRQKLDLCKLLRRDLHDWFADLDALGFQRDVEYLPSFRGAKPTQKDDPHIKSEHHTSTVGLLLWPLHLARRRHEKREQAFALDVLKQVVSFLIDDVAVCALLKQPPLPGECALCAAHRGAAPGCSHLTYFLYVASQVDIDTIEKGCEFLLALSKAADASCATLRTWFARLCRALAPILDARVLRGECDANVLKDIDLLKNGERRLRINDDYKAAILDAPSSGRATCGNSLARALGEVNPDSATGWLNNYLASYSASVALTRAGDETIAYDATKIGQPAEECECYVAYRPDVDVGFVLPPQAG